MNIFSDLSAGILDVLVIFRINVSVKQEGMTKYHSVDQSLDKLISTSTPSSDCSVSTNIGENYAQVRTYGDYSGILGIAYNYCDTYIATAGLIEYYVLSFVLAIVLLLILCAILYHHNKRKSIDHSRP